MNIPEHSIALITAAHHEEIVNKLKAEKKALEDALKKEKKANLANMAFAAKLIAMLKKHNIRMEVQAA